MRNPRVLLSVALMAILPLALLGWLVTREMAGLQERREAEAHHTAAYTGDLARAHILHLLDDYFRPRRERLLYAHLRGQAVFEATLREIYFTSTLMDLPQFLPEDQLRGPNADTPAPSSHAFYHLGDGAAMEKPWDRAVADVLQRHMIVEARERMGYDPESGRFARASLEDAESLEIDFRWLLLDIRDEDGRPCPGCGPQLDRIGYEVEEGVYDILAFSFPLPGREDVPPGMFGAAVPWRQLAREIVQHALLPGSIRLADRRGRAVLSGEGERERPSEDRPILWTGAVLGADSPWRLEVMALDAGALPTSGRRGQRWTLLYLGSLGILALGLVLVGRRVARQTAHARMRRGLLGNISHELKTPLALIRLYTETLEADRVGNEFERKRFLGIIARESKRLTHLIDNILDIQRIEEERKRYSYAQVRPDRVVRNTVEAYRFHLTEEGFDLRLDVDDELPLMMVDEEALAQALINLLDNAVKYSDTAKEVAVSCARQDDTVRIAVADRGIGIPPREQARIFRKFYRVEQGLVHNVKGSGLGLAVVEHVAQAHGGHVALESTPGKGSTFTLVLPVGFDPEQS